MARAFFAIVALCLILVWTGASPAAASEPVRFRLGLTTGADASARQRIEPLRRYLERALDRPVDLFLYETMGETAEALRKNTIDFARLSPTAYAVLAQTCSCVTPLVTARRDRYSAHVFAVLLARAGDAKKGLNGLKGARLGVGPPGSVVTRQIPLVHLQREGTVLSSAFSRIVTVASPQAGLSGLLAGKLDLVAAWSTLAGEPASGFSAGTLKTFHDQGGDLAQIAGVWMSPPLPYTAHTVRSALPADFKARLQAALVSLLQREPDAYAAFEPEFPGGLEPVAPADYDGFAVLAACPEVETGKPCP